MSIFLFSGNSFYILLTSLNWLRIFKLIFDTFIKGSITIFLNPYAHNYTSIQNFNKIPDIISYGNLQWRFHLMNKMTLWMWSHDFSWNYPLISASKQAMKLKFERHIFRKRTVGKLQTSISFQKIQSCNPRPTLFNKNYPQCKIQLHIMRENSYVVYINE